MNKAAGNRTISKQECMVLAAGLNLVECTDMIETVSLSGAYKIGKKSAAMSTIVAQYANRDLDGPEGTMSLDEFFRNRKRFKTKTIIPHYVGGRSQPIYPVTEGYARSVLIIHKPWHGTDPRDDDEKSYIAEFEAFITSTKCPKTVSITYERVKNRYLEKTTNIESVAEPIVLRQVPQDDPETRELLDIVASFQEGCSPHDDMSSYQYERGLNFDWGKKRFQVSLLWPSLMRVQTLV
jgi:hypothetical protein